MGKPTGGAREGQTNVLILEDDVNTRESSAGDEAAGEKTRAGCAASLSPSGGDAVCSSTVKSEAQTGGSGARNARMFGVSLVSRAYDVTVSPAGCT
eukprot:scaffold238988_cov31-Tisochrysis_lutea.AAC.1